VRAWKAKTAIRVRDVGDAAPADAPTLAPAVLTLEPTGPTLAPRLCYACHTALTSRSSKSAARGGDAAGAETLPLPVWTAAGLAALSRVGIEGGADTGAMESEEGSGVVEADAPEMWETRRLDPAAMRSVVGEFLLED
jgi:cytoplasmic tRNA 2-thiolation protein 2